MRLSTFSLLLMFTCNGALAQRIEVWATEIARRETGNGLEHILWQNDLHLIEHNGMIYREVKRMEGGGP